MSQNIGGKVVVVTGAGRGLGKATARHLVAEGTATLPAKLSSGFAVTAAFFAKKTRNIEPVTFL